MTSIPYIPTHTCGEGLHMEYPKPEPVFHFMKKDGNHGVTSLDMIKAWARLVHQGEALVEEFFRELYVILPHGRSLLRCTFTFGGTDKEPKLLITGTASISGVLHTVDL